MINLENIKVGDDIDIEIADGTIKTVIEIEKRPRAKHKQRGVKYLLTTQIKYFKEDDERPFTTESYSVDGKSLYWSGDQDCNIIKMGDL